MSSSLGTSIIAVVVSAYLLALQAKLEAHADHTLADIRSACPLLVRSCGFSVRRVWLLFVLVMGWPDVMLLLLQGRRSLALFPLMNGTVICVPSV